ENAEYIYRKKQLGGIDRRVRFLSKRIPALRVIETAPTDRTAIFFGAQVTVERGDTREQARYRVVGPDETDAVRGYISIDSPLARALLAKREGDEVTAQLPGGPATFEILDVAYEN
ncbi:MAG: GreA/GreB family elongation factor, partial [Lysobacterales bacterium]